MNLQNGKLIPVVLEIGQKRTFASALDWSGWARSGRAEKEALETLLAYRDRYQLAITSSGLTLPVIKTVAEFNVVERLQGDASTDFGAPGIPPSTDAAPADEIAIGRLLNILKACWQYWDSVSRLAAGRSLRTGPRGGGRTLEKIIAHVIEAHYSYLIRIYWREPHSLNNDITALTRADTQALSFAVSPAMPQNGPRGGALWSARYFVRRAAWHILDHAWEIEDRLE
jgi:hypothetical protein